MAARSFLTGLYFLRLLLTMDIVASQPSITQTSAQMGKHRRIKFISDRWFNRRHLLRYQQDTPNLFDSRYLKDDPLRFALVDDRSNVVAGPIVQSSRPSNARHKSIPTFLGLVAIGGGAYFVVTQTSVWQRIAGNSLVRSITPKSMQGYAPLKRSSSKGINDPLLRTASKQKSKFTNRAEVHLMLNALDISLPPDVIFHGPRVWPHHRSKREKSRKSINQSVEMNDLHKEPPEFDKVAPIDGMKPSRADPLEQIRSLAVKSKVIKKKDRDRKM